MPGRVQVGEARALRQKRAADDAQREARVAALQKTNRGLDGVGVALGAREELRDRRRHRHAARRGPRAAAELVGQPRDEWRREQPQEQPERRVGLRDREPEIGRMQAQEPGEVRRRGVRRVELGHRRCDE
jgi:hypothetical protein